MHHSIARSNGKTQQGSLDPRVFFESPTHEEALARLQFLVENGRQAGLVVGDSGTGKSMLLHVFANQLQHRDCQIAVVDLIGLEQNEMLCQVAIQLGLNLDPDLPRHTIWRILSDRIRENRFQQIPTVVLLDDIDQASPEIMHQVQRLLHIDSSPESRMTVVFSSQVAGLPEVDPRLLMLADLRIELESWDQCDTANYLSHCLRLAGRQETTFETAAIHRIQLLSEGVPRRVHQLAELALIASRGSGTQAIDVETIISVYEELSVAIAQ